MRKTAITILLSLAGLLFVTMNQAYAARFDYSDAPSSYATVRHNTGEWQRLGNVWNKENSPQSPDGDTSDDGVFWSNDGGVTWGHDAVSVGDEVMFGFKFTRAGYGVHEYDGLNAWVDWNGDNIWNNNESVINIKWDKGATQVADNVYREYLNQNGTVINPGAELSRFFVSNSFTITREMGLLNGLWLRARVACSSSINNAGGSITPYNNIWQGETEDWFMETRPGGETPEPATMLLLGTGLAAVRAIKRRRKS